MKNVVTRYTHPQSKYVLRPEPGIYAEDISEGADKQACSDEQHKGERYFGGD